MMTHLSAPPDANLLPKNVIGSKAINSVQVKNMFLQVNLGLFIITARQNLGAF